MCRRVCQYLGVSTVMHVGHVSSGLYGACGMTMTGQMSIRAFILYLHSLLPLLIIRTSPSRSALFLVAANTIHQNLE